MEIVSPYKEAIDLVKESGGVTNKFCYQCGMCDSVCPWNRVTNFSIRNLVRQATFGLPEFEGEDIWRCTTCNTCPQRCPRGVEQINVVVSIRRIATEAGITPASIHTVAANLGGEGNPLGEPRSTRGDWAKDLSVKPFAEDMEILYFPGCYLSYDGRLKKVAAATVNILNKAGVNFGILGDKENCCGESIRKTGDEELFKRLAKENIKTFIDAGVKRVMVSSPHCYHTFLNEYPEFKANFEIVHIAQYLHELISQGRLKLDKRYDKKITYHDPCYLGRHNDVYDEPREVLKQASGRDVLEMTDTRKESLCCGGGGGGIWMDRKKGERFADIRVEQAVATGAQVLVTACPYCIINFEDSRLTLENSDALEVKDITEIVQEII